MCLKLPRHTTVCVIKYQLIIFFANNPNRPPLNPETKLYRLLDIYNPTYHTQLPQKFPLNMFLKQVSSLLQIFTVNVSTLRGSFSQYLKKYIGMARYS